MLFRSAFAQTFVWAFYSYGGVELVSLAAGETAKPHKTVPRAIKATFFRIVVFYILAVLTIGLCINNTDETLLNAAYGACIFYYWCSFVFFHYFLINASVFRIAGASGLPTVVNSVALSC